MSTALVITGLCVSGISLVVSILSAINSYRVGKAQKLLADKQILKIATEEKEKKKPRITIEYLDSCLFVTNSSQVSVKAFSVDVKSANERSVRLVHDNKFPIEVFTPGSNLKFIVARVLGNSSDLIITLKGKTEDDEDFNQSSNFSLR